MTLWNSLTRKFVRPRGWQAQQALAEAYQDVLQPGRKATDAQKEMVLADLCNFSGWLKVSGLGFSAVDRAFAEGMRATYGRVFRFLSLGEMEQREMNNAARQEAIADMTQGEI